ncbi:hypothetical protein BJ508DRAFT_334580 [Ascobolus immersus RN42]|uniref:Uncharacterized protein n=1 Tax=Ascobolus immersus RN42 TaxID=1160509 RepID=A0A3N4HFG4_ASCIM|nr:hypothetical protein BJ508DRAFT_334580 [Ascobolus immersus RN42]
MSEEWKRMVEKDTCVPDYLARLDWTEDFSSVFVMAAYHGSALGNSIFAVQSDSGQRPQDCMLNQMNGAIHILLNERPMLKHDWNARCEGPVWLQRSPTVCMGEDARRDNKCDGVPDYSSQRLAQASTGSEPPILERSASAKTGFRAYSISAAKADVQGKAFTA